MEALIDTVAFCQNAFAVVGLFDFDEHQGHAVDQQNDVGPELFVAVLVGELGDDVKTVVVEVLEVDQLGAGALSKLVVEGLAKIIVVQREFDIRQQTVYVRIGHAGIDLADSLAKYSRKYIGIQIP